MDEEGRPGKRDRLARLTRVVALLRAHPDGMRVEDLAKRIGVSKRTAYRDLVALQEEVRLPVWGESGVFGLESEEFLPPLKLTRSEAMAVVLSARLMTRYADKFDPDLASAFEKLEAALPPPLAAHVARTLDVLAARPTDETFSRHVHLLTQAWAERRIVTLDYAPARYGPDSEPRSARVRPYLLEPSLQTHALYLIGWDETRDALRTFKVERIRDMAVGPDTFEPPDDDLGQLLSRAWDIIADQPPVEIVLRFAPSVATRVGEARWHPTQQVAGESDGSLVWRATVAGTIEVRLWVLSWGDEVEVLEPASLRDDVAATHARAAQRYRKAD